MTGTPVSIRSVTLDPSFTKHATRERYRVTLECGCFWWEDHSAPEQVPKVGTTVNCYAKHLSGQDSRPAVHGQDVGGEYAPASRGR
jgi:hypothetical protein